MNINTFVRVTVSAAIALAPLLTTASAAAHVVVKPAEVVTAGFTTFTVGVPNEKDMPTISFKLVMPEGLEHVTPTQKPGWLIDIARHGSGATAHVEAVTWSGNAINAGLRDDFTFSAKVPSKATELHWKAYQTYEDGSVVAWDKASSAADKDEASKTSGPFSITRVVSEASEKAAITEASQATDAAKADARRAQTTALVALAVAVIAVLLATRRKK